MEKRARITHRKLKRVVLTGPECTGKTTLANQLAGHFNSIYVPEYAREYIAKLSRPYNYQDVMHIAETQLRQQDDFALKANNILFLDTYLIITKIWMDIVFKHHPLWIDNELTRNTIDLYLLCNTDIPWVADPVRENGGEMREKLYELYKDELDRIKSNYKIISGTGTGRLHQAIMAVNMLINTNSLNQ
jgi:NadR type nicotinamide-nucleotide adenylyltransferase